MDLDRRSLLLGAAVGAGAFAAAKPALAVGPNPFMGAAIARYAAQPLSASCLVDAADPRGPWTAAYNQNAALFVGSAIKSFILAQFMRDVEAERLVEEAPQTVDDSIRSLGSPVFRHLTGNVPGTSVLEAMIAHSDNTATDIAMKA